MSDLFFVVKCFLYTLLITFLMQLKVAGISIESRAESLLKNSPLTSYLQDAADGGASLLQDGYYTTKKIILDSTRSFRSGFESNESRASRR